MQLIWVVLTFPLEIIMNASKSILGFVLKKKEAEKHVQGQPSSLYG